MKNSFVRRRDGYPLPTQNNLLSSRTQKQSTRDHVDPLLRRHWRHSSEYVYYNLTLRRYRYCNR